MLAFRKVFLFSIISARLLFSEGSLFFVQGDSADSDLLNIVFLAEGYTVQQESDFCNDVAEITTYMFSQIPYKQYASFFNVWGIYVSSMDSGADHPLQNSYKDTYFGATFGTSTPRLVTFSNSVKAIELLAEHVPDYDLVCLLVNDQEYGGSGGMFAVVTLNSSVLPMLLHEIGHTFAGLADEYETSYSIPPMEKLNVTAVTIRDDIKWNDWIATSTPIPTPKISSNAGVVGLFEGAMYQPTGWYRPKLQCRMRSLDTPFCEVCLEAHVFQIYLQMSPIKNYSPQTTTIVCSGNPLSFTVETRSPVPNTLQIFWMQDNRIIAQGTKTVSLNKTQMNEPGFSIKAIVRDTTSLVRNADMLDAIEDFVQWDVIVKSTVAQPKNNLDGMKLIAAHDEQSIILKVPVGYPGALFMEMFTFKGQRIYSRRLDINVYHGTMGNYRIPVSGMKSGAYIVKVSSPLHTEEKCLKFIKMH